MPYNPQTMNLNAAQANAQASKDSFGTSGPQIIDAPAGTKYFAMKKEMIGQDVYLNIIPWGIETANHMGVHNGTAQIGQGEYLLEMWTHRVEGVTQGATLCLQRMYGSKCPFCEASRNSGAGEAKASHRCAFWVQHVDVHGNPIGGDPTPKLFITSYATFGKALLDAAEVQGRRLGLPGPIPFANPGTDGKIVAFRVNSKSGGGFNFTEATNFDFLPRPYAIPQSILDNIPGLDRFLHIPTEKEINEALYGSDALPAQGAAAGYPAQGSAPAYQAPAQETPANYGAPAYQQQAQAQPQYQAPAQETPAPNANPYGAPAAGAPAAGAPANPYGAAAAATPYGSASAQVPHGARPTPGTAPAAAPAAEAAPATGYPEPTF